MEADTAVPPAVPSPGNGGTRRGGGCQTEPGVGVVTVGQSQDLPDSSVFFFFPFYLSFNLSALVAHMFA